MPGFADFPERHLSGRVQVLQKRMEVVQVVNQTGSVNGIYILTVNILLHCNNSAKLYLPWFKGKEEYQG